MAGDDTIQDSARVLHQGKASRDSTLLPADVLVNSGPAYRAHRSGPAYQGPHQGTQANHQEQAPRWSPPLQLQPSEGFGGRGCQHTHSPIEPAVAPATAPQIRGPIMPARACWEVTPQMLMLTAMGNSR